MSYLRCWHFGLIGTVVLFLATAIKMVCSISMFFTEDIPWHEALYFPFQIIAMGFLSGVLVWAVFPLSKRLGLLGDAIVGLVGMNFFFLLCMLILDPSLIYPNLVKGLPMFGLASVLGPILGFWVGKDLRKWTKEELSKSQVDDSPREHGDSVNSPNARD